MHPTESDVAAARSALEGIARYWWAMVLVGVALVLYGFVILSFTIETVFAVAVFVGVGLIASGIAEIAASRMAERYGTLLLVLGILDLALGVAALLWPDITFVVLVRIVGWVLLLRGISDVVSAFQARSDREEGWWLPLALGIAQIVLAIWAVRYPGRSLVLLVLWAGTAVLARGIGTIFLGFTLRGVKRELRTTA